MKRYAIVLLLFVFIAGTTYLADAIHDHEQIPTKQTGLGHYEKMPAASGGDLRHFITGHQPYKDWSTWPGKGPMVKSAEPHGNYVTVYINDIAERSLKSKQKLANNSIILKDNYNAEKKLVAVTVMYKVTGYNPAGGDWFWAKYDPDFKILAEGKVTGCLNCHTKAKENDFVFTGNVK